MGNADLPIKEGRGSGRVSRADVTMVTFTLGVGALGLVVVM